ncbi:MAG: hypothetical protein JWO31_2682 [Phycisphaerales bacterium]|nr:hypothetical protein [Phycisphaerales bacterium]
MIPVWCRPSSLHGETQRVRTCRLESLHHNKAAAHMTSQRTTAARVARFESLESRQLMSAVAPTDLEQYMLELVNRARANPTAEAARFGVDLNEGLAAGTISADAKQPLAFNPAIIDAARGHSQEMIATDVFAHAGANGSSPGQRMATAGYAAAGTFGWGENIAYRGSKPTAPPGLATTAAEHKDLFVDAGIEGRGHRTNLLNGAYKEVGVGIATGDFQTYSALMSTEDFGYVNGTSFLTGVAFTDAVTADNFYTPGEGLGGVTLTAVRAGDGLTKTATTWSTGGYALAVPAGTYTVTASGGGLPNAVTFNAVAVGATNVKLDVRPSAVPPVVVPPVVVPPIVVPPVTVPPVVVPPAAPPVVPPAPPVVPADPTPTEPVPTDESGEPAGPVSPPPPPAGVIRGAVWADANGNGKREKREGGAAGRLVFLDVDGDGSAGADEPTATTDAAGGYAFTGLAAGDYTVRLAAADGWRTTTSGDSDTSDTRSVNVTATAAAGESGGGTTAVAKVKPIDVTDRVAIGGTVFADLDGNGVRDTAEPAYRKAKVFLDLDADGIRGKTEPVAKVDAAGRWRFAALSAGSYTVRLVLRPTAVATAPAGGAWSIAVAAGDADASDLAFGVTAIASPAAGKRR